MFVKYLKFAYCIYLRQWLYERYFAFDIISCYEACHVVNFSLPFLCEKMLHFIGLNYEKWRSKLISKVTASLLLYRNGKNPIIIIIFSVGHHNKSRECFESKCFREFFCHTVLLLNSNFFEKKDSFYFWKDS